MNKKGLAFVSAMFCSLISQNVLGANLTNAVLLEFRQQIDCKHPRRILTVSNHMELPFDTTLHTRERATALVRLTDATVLRVAERTELEILDPLETDESPIIHLLRGSLFSHSRNKKRGVRVRTGLANAVTTGTDFEITAEEGRNVFHVFDGAVRVANELGEVSATNGWQVVVDAGQKPRVQPIVVPDLVQWWLHYPAALDLQELHFSDEERRILAEPIGMWEKGNIRAAIESWPQNVISDSISCTVFTAAIELAAGRVERAEKLLSSISESSKADGTRAVLAAIQKQAWYTNYAPTSASASLGLSWWFQSRHDIPGALNVARDAARRSPQWGLAWARIAELEFSSGNIRQAGESLLQALRLAPEFAPAHALHGFVLASQNENSRAITAFEEALRLDGLLGEAWLGRGLCLIRIGQKQEGLIALQNAVGAEPERAVLRSYLGKAWEQIGDTKHAREELDYARRLDLDDPTGWLYSALLEEREHRYNKAVRDLEQSIARNENRAVYRSELLLDEDRSVRGANLARLYDRAGVTEVGLREAARAAEWDYASWSSHLFLAESYDALRDPARVNLRYETPWFSELLLARLLAPAAAGAFSQNLSQQEYTRLFEVNRIGLNSSTEWRSDGRWRERATQYGIEGGTSWAIDLDWEQRDERHNRNNELNRLEIYPQLKQQVTESDSLLLFGKIYDYHAGDVRQLENPNAADTTLDSRVSQLPIVAAGWHHEWSPGVHTLILGARLEDDQRVKTDQLGALGFQLMPPPPIIETAPLSLRYRGQLEIWSAEINQIVEANHHTFVAGMRGQAGEFDTHNVLRTNSLTGGAATFFDNPAAAGHETENFSRFTIYAYDHYEIVKGLLLIGGVAYDRVEYPRNFSAPPINRGTRTRDAVEPKGGVVWSPSSALTLRGMYAQSLGGASFDESFRIEPSQIAGFPQVYRSLIPESVGGGSSGQEFEIWGVAADVKLWTNTYFGLEGGRRCSDELNTVGAFELGGVGNYAPTFLDQKRRYEETFLGASVHQLLDDNWSAAVGWNFTRSELSARSPLLSIASQQQADLHELWLRVLFNHSSGFFARGDLESFWQDSESRSETVCELDFFAGWRFKRQLGEISAGILNVTGANHRLNPLNPLAELPRERVFVTQIKFNF